MLKLRLLSIGSSLGLALLLTSAAAAQEPAKSNGKTSVKLGERIVHLIPPPVVEDLKLSDEQAEEFRKLEQEFQAKRRQHLLATGLKVARMIEAGDADEELAEPAPVLAIAHEVTGVLLEMRRARAAYEKKALALFEPEQKENYLKFKKTGEVRTAGEREIVSREMQRRLKLTPEQRQQLREAVERSLREILTDDQKQLLEGREKSKRK